MKTLVSPSLEGALLRFRILAVLIGIGLAVLVFVGIPLQVGASNDVVVNVVGPIHGTLYIIYLLAGLDLVVRARMSIFKLVLMASAGLIPLLVLLVLRSVGRWVSEAAAADRR